MMNANLKAMADGIVATVKEYVGGVVAGIERRFAEFDAKLAGIPAGPKGDKGDRGEKGEQGPQGEKGERGERGEKGDQGDRGLQGEKGEAGPIGPQGEKGDRGEPGLRGEKGDKGDPGERGDPGEKGSDADPALIEELVERAVARIPVIKGDPGEPGPVGPQGPAGRDGESVHPDTVFRMVHEVAQKAKAEIIAELPTPRDGEQGPAGKDGRDGKDADPEQIRPIVDEYVARSVEPITQDFADFTDELLRGLEEDRIAFEKDHPGVVVNAYFQSPKTKAAQQDDSEDDPASVARAIYAIGADIKQTLERPVVPVRDKKGKTIAARRVKSLDEA